MKLKTIFREADTDGDRYLTATELKTYIQTVGMNTILSIIGISSLENPEERFNSLVENVNASSHSQVGLNHFLYIMSLTFQAEFDESNNNNNKNNVGGNQDNSNNNDINYNYNNDLIADLSYNYLTYQSTTNFESPITSYLPLNINNNFNNDNSNNNDIYNNSIYNSSQSIYTSYSGYNNNNNTTTTSSSSSSIYTSMEDYSSTSNMLPPVPYHPNAIYSSVPNYTSENLTSYYPPYTSPQLNHSNSSPSIPSVYPPPPNNNSSPQLLSPRPLNRSANIRFGAHKLDRSC